LADAVRASIGNCKDIKGGCFCQARAHLLSVYIPICRQCGLILCELNLPHFACPHCSSQILSSPVRASLLPRLEEQISACLAKEERDREQEREHARQAAGNFPALRGPHNGAPVATFLPRLSPPLNQTHKVLSLNSKTKKVTVSSYAASPAPAHPHSHAEDIEEEPVRVPKPPSEAAFAAKLDHSRPWTNLTCEDGIEYIPRPTRPVPGEVGDAESPQRTRTRRNRGVMENVCGTANARTDTAEL